MLNEIYTLNYVQNFDLPILSEREAFFCDAQFLGFHAFHWVQVFLCFHRKSFTFLFLKGVLFHLFSLRGGSSVSPFSSYLFRNFGCYFDSHHDLRQPVVVDGVIRIHANMYGICLRYFHAGESFSNSKLFARIRPTPWQGPVHGLTWDNFPHWSLRIRSSWSVSWLKCSCKRFDHLKVFSFSNLTFQNVTHWFSNILNIFFWHFLFLGRLALSKKSRQSHRKVDKKQNVHEVPSCNGSAPQYQSYFG